jgi:hypothetical protein
MTMRDDRLLSGFLNHDYILTFTVGDAERRQRLVELCRGPWMGDAVTDDTWEVSNDLGPDDMERTLLGLLADGDRCAYYYLTPPMESGVPGSPPSKRIFRVVLG